MNSLADKLNQFMDAVDTVLVFVAKLILAAMVAVTFVSVIARTFFNSSVPDDLLMNEMFMVALVFLPLGWVQSIGAHLEVTVLTDFFPDAVQKILISFGLLLGLVVFGGMTYASWHTAYEAYVFDQLAYNSVLGLREWPVMLIIPIGLAWWCLRLFIQLVVPASRPATETEFDSAVHEAEHIPEQRSDLHAERVGTGVNQQREVK